jgi:CHAD domain-containing protein
MLSRRLEKMLDYLEGVRSGKEFEAIHQMRVWSRRSRAALDIFRPCFPGKQFRALEQEVKRITRALGAARDLDVMILNLQARKETVPERHRAGVEDLVQRLQKQRKAAQIQVEQAAARLERASVLTRFARLAEEEYSEAGEGKIARSWPGMIEPGASLMTNAARAIEMRLDGLLGYEQFVYQPECVLELHEMRIAAKRLRYTMEIFQPLYTRHTASAKAFESALQEVRLLQEHLGEIHDADVLVPRLTSQLARMLRPGFGKDEDGEPIVGVHKIDLDACEGLLTLCRQIQKERETRYARFCQDWERLKAERALPALRRLLFAALPAQQEETS